MICTDLDGTYLNRQGKVSAYSRKIWNEAVASGFLVTVASARSPAFVSYVLKGHQKTCPIVSLGGAVSFDPMRKQVVGRNHLSANVVRELLAIGRKHDLAPMLLEVRDDVTEVCQTLENPSFETIKFLDAKQRKPIFVANYQAYEVANRILVVTFVGQDELLLELSEDSKWLTDAGAVSCRRECYSGGSIVEFKSKKATKEIGVAELANVSNFDIGSATVFGDAMDDVGMFLSAGYSIAVANADETAKNMADVVSVYTNDQNAVARHLLTVL